MFERKKPDKTVLPEDEVRLPFLLGIRPGIYLACLYGLAALAVLFIILLYPGLSKPGSVITVNSEPWGAAVLVDGVYMDAAPCEIFVPAGSRRIELRLPGFIPKQIDMDIKGRVFASALFPLKVVLRETLQAPAPVAAFYTEAAEFAAWTFTGEPSAAYQIPLSLSEGAYRLGPAAADPATRKFMDDTITASARFAVTRAALRDLIRAKALLDNQGLSPSPASLLGSASDIIAFLDENPQAALWLASALGGDAQSALLSSSWYAEQAAATGYIAATAAAGSSQTIQLGQLGFQLLGGGLLSGANFPEGTRVDAFYMSQTLISAAAWERFIEQEPWWGLDNIEELKEEGFASEAYLQGIDHPNAPVGGVSGISWYAAGAFCRWLSGFLPPSLAAWEVRLPSEAEWEYAASTGALDTPASFWEWCQDAFVPLSFLSAPSAAAAGLGSPERSLRGGSWINHAGSVSIETRASLPPSHCSPFVSFRPVIALRATGDNHP